MNIKLNYVLALTCIIVLSNVTTAQTKSPGKKTVKGQPAKATFTKDPVTGVEYHFYKQDKKGKKPAMGDYAKVTMVYETEGDSVIFDSHKKGGDSIGAVTIPVKKSFNGCLEQGIAMMAIGDSAEFKINSDSLFLKSFHMRGRPPRMQSYNSIVFHIRLLKIQTEQDLKDEQKKATEAVKMKEKSSITKYFNDSNIHVTPTVDSLFILKQTASGNKPLVQEGDSVFITYVGKLLNGKVFDQSADHKGVPGFVTIHDTATLAMVYSQSMPLIHGWVEAIGKMHAGDKITILCPSSIAYGARAMGATIPPYSPLIFDMQMLKVVPHTTK